MAAPSASIACDSLGTSSKLNGWSCCHLDSQNSTACNALFAPSSGILNDGCAGFGNRCALYERCMDVSNLYRSLEQDGLEGVGDWLIRRYRACANVPSIASLLATNQLSADLRSKIQVYMPPVDDPSFYTSLQMITSSVTDCLSSTCRASRDDSFCYEDHCSPVKLLINNTLPNIEGINDCLYTLCNGDTQALPWADSDVVGIGVFASYVMQCSFVVILWVGLLAFSRLRSSRGQPERPSEMFKPGKHYAAWIDLLLEFHKAQCYFSSTLMVASIVFGITNVDILITFLLIPLATNSILPVIFAYVLLLYFRSSSAATTTLTAAVYTLSSIVYWILYAHLRLPNGNTPDDMYRLYKLKLSSIQACGGYSGLAVCPYASKSLDVPQGIDARTKLRVLTPLIWTFSSFVFFATLVYQAYEAYARRSRRTQPDMTSRGWRAAFWLTTIVFLAGVGMQLAVLWTAIILGMVDVYSWKFGQIVAVTIWIPPLLEYFCNEINDVWAKRIKPRYMTPSKPSLIKPNGEPKKETVTTGLDHEEAPSARPEPAHLPQPT